MTWKLGIVAGAVLLAGCDTRPEAVVRGEMRLLILDRCQNRMYPIPERVGYSEHSYYCNCLRDTITQGKSRSELIAMERDAARYMEPGANVIRQCTAQAIHEAREYRQKYSVFKDDDSN